MALHDDQVSARFKDRCHELAWTLDAVIARKSITEQHLAKLREFFAPHAAAGRRRAQRLAAKRQKGGEEHGRKRKKAKTSELDIGESTGHGSGADPEADKVSSQGQHQLQVHLPAVLGATVLTMRSLIRHDAV